MYSGRDSGDSGGSGGLGVYSGRDSGDSGGSGGLGVYSGRDGGDTGLGASNDTGGSGGIDTSEGRDRAADDTKGTSEGLSEGVSEGIPEGVSFNAFHQWFVHDLCPTLRSLTGGRLLDYTLSTSLNTSRKAGVTAVGAPRRIGQPLGTTPASASGRALAPAFASGRAPALASASGRALAPALASASARAGRSGRGLHRQDSPAMSTYQYEKHLRPSDVCAETHSLHSDSEDEGSSEKDNEDTHVDRQTAGDTDHPWSGWSSPAGAVQAITATGQFVGNSVHATAALVGGTIAATHETVSGLLLLLRPALPPLPPVLPRVPPPLLYGHPQPQAQERRHQSRGFSFLPMLGLARSGDPRVVNEEDHMDGAGHSSSRSHSPSDSHSDGEGASVNSWEQQADQRNDPQWLFGLRNRQAFF